MKQSLLFACIIYCPCLWAAVSDVASTGRDSFVVTAQAKNGWSTPGAQKTKVYERAHIFCAARDKEMQTISSKLSFNGQAAYAELEFRCVNSN